MATYGVRVNPVTVKEGSLVATKYDPYTLEIKKTRQVKKVDFCPGKPENFHVDHECYDTRFSTIVIPA